MFKKIFCKWNEKRIRKIVIERENEVKAKKLYDEIMDTDNLIFSNYDKENEGESYSGLLFSMRCLRNTLEVKLKTNDTDEYSGLEIPKTYKYDCECGECDCPLKESSFNLRELASIIRKSASYSYQKGYREAREDFEIKKKPIKRKATKKKK